MNRQILVVFVLPYFLLPFSMAMADDTVLWDAMDLMEAPFNFSSKLLQFETSVVEFLYEEPDELQMETTGLNFGVSQNSTTPLGSHPIPTCATIRRNRDAARQNVRRMIHHSQQLRNQTDLSSSLGRCLADWHRKQIKKYRDQALAVFPKSYAFPDRRVTYRWKLRNLPPHTQVNSIDVPLVSAWEGQFNYAQWLALEGNWPQLEVVDQELVWELTLSPSRFCGKGVVGHFEGQLHFRTTSGQDKQIEFSAFAAGLD